uniref:Uncharacterized protein n=1 Tax=Theropithecus gelada TaxID=9565 RepID=A0A8D2EQQ8_THEGE
MLSHGPCRLQPQVYTQATPQATGPGICTCVSVHTHAYTGLWPRHMYVCICMCARTHTGLWPRHIYMCTHTHARGCGPGICTCARTETRAHTHTQGCGRSICMRARTHTHRTVAEAYAHMPRIHAHTGLWPRHMYVCTHTHAHTRVVTADRTYIYIF